MFFLQTGSHPVLAEEGEEVEKTTAGGLSRALDVVKMMEAAEAVVVVGGAALVVKVAVLEVKH